MVIKTVLIGNVESILEKYEGKRGRSQSEAICTVCVPSNQISSEWSPMQLATHRVPGVKVVCKSTELCDGITCESLIQSAEQVNVSSIV